MFLFSSVATLQPAPSGANKGVCGTHAKGKSNMEKMVQIKRVAKIKLFVSQVLVVNMCLRASMHVSESTVRTCVHACVITVTHFLDKRRRSNLSKRY